MNISRKPNAFTLIELLVVISIIALLLAILMPSLGKVKEIAKGTVCMAHQHQAALANITYATENDGYNVPSWANFAADGKTPQQWFTYLKTYIGESEGTFACPKAAKLDEANKHGAGIFGSADSGWFSDTSVHTLAGENDIGGFGYNNWLESGTAGKKIPKQSSAKQPFKVPAFGDCTWSDAGWVEETQIIAPEEKRDNPEFAGGGWVRRFSMYRHGDGINIAFLDGHGEKGIEVDDLLSYRWHGQWSSSLVPNNDE